jgi:ABC-type nitrate/sulfonate/bicarbonate transport system permease component
VQRTLRAAPALIVLGFLLLWEGLSHAGLVSALFYPPPSAIARTLARLIASGELLTHLSASCLRIVVGFAWGAGAGALLGVLMGWSKPVRSVLDPLVAAAHPVPRLALLPLILLLFGIGETSRLVVVAISAFFPQLINSTAGVRQIEPIYFEVARSFGAPRLRVFTRVVLAGSLPALLTGARLAFVAALRTTLAIELITSDNGLGHMLWFAWETFRTEELYATLAVIALLGFGVNQALQRASALAMPWRDERS